jgi:hypothetical protein
MSWWHREKKTRLSVRRFLNNPGHQSGAYILIYVEDSDTEEYEAYQQGSDGFFDPEITLELKDCDRAISFEFQLGTESNRENSMFKVNTLIYALLKLRKAIKAESRLAERRERELRERQEKKAEKKKD